MVINSQKLNEHSGHYYSSSAEGLHLTLPDTCYYTGELVANTKDTNDSIGGMVINTKET